MGDAPKAMASSAATVSPIGHSITDQIKCPLYLAAPQALADALHSIGETGPLLTVCVRDLRPTFDRLSDMLDAHRRVEPVKHMTGRTNARRLSQRPRPWPVRAIAVRARRCARAMQHAARLLGLAGRPRPALLKTIRSA
jgi:hypothetical protein